MSRDRDIALRLRAALIRVPYHRNPQIPAGQPFGYPVGGHREWDCPVCVVLIDAEEVLGEFDFASDPEFGRTPPPVPGEGE